MLVYTGKTFVPLSEVIERPEVAALREDLVLEYRSHRLELVKKFRSKFPDIVSYPRLVSVQASDTNLCQKMCERNHHRKNFRSVYPSDYNYKNLSFDWD